MTTNIKGVEAALSAHVVFLQALALTHPDRARLRYVFSELMSRLIASTQDPQMGGFLHGHEELFRAMLDVPGVDGPPAAR